ncbi:Coiled-coil-helix-coiled-coil-helix domain-containing protein 8 [Pteropus alecto]|uniref:Coiled-coil-helix-coiled-coil-helix domain-containing protein 8 n=1 Tax=Pteropus alecto TaxID=9402 RepID=L5JN48_PTEAL|nr:Coiled-coil-helix-coiled-coil-helix domain-containing protein 8 [Pteropus alecto]
MKIRGRSLPPTSACALPTEAGSWQEGRKSSNCPQSPRAGVRVRGPLVNLFGEHCVPRPCTVKRNGHNWGAPSGCEVAEDPEVKKEGEEEDPLDQLISRSGCAASHYAVQECMAQHQDWRQCQPQVQAFRNCMSEQQARRREELQRRKDQGSSHS